MLIRVVQVSDVLADSRDDPDTDASSIISDEQDATNSRILALVKDLGNAVLTKSRASELHR